MVQPTRSSGAGFGFLAIVVALLFIVGPNFISWMGFMSQFIIMAFGTLFLIAGSTVVIITRLYNKTASDEAFVRTGMGGPKVVIDGGAVVLPVVHEIRPVSLQTMKLIVPRQGENALITGDNLRADVIAEFFIRVQKNRDDVLAASTSLGEKAMNPELVEKMVFEKLVNSLRTVAATKSLSELHTKREEFASAVHTSVMTDLKHNGLTLESVTISKLDQTPPSALNPNNVFDAQGLRRIAQITNEASVERNKIEMEATKLMKLQGVEKDLFVYKQDVERAEAEATRNRDMAKATVKADQEAATFSAEQMRLAGIARVDKEQAIEVAEIEKGKAVEVSNQERQQAAKQAEIGKMRALEIAEREKQIAVATKEQERAKAETLRLEAEVKREEQNQAVYTVGVVKTAEREKEQKVLQEQAEIQKTKLRQEMEADVRAYTLTKAATAEQQAAEQQADARRIRAQAEKDANMLEAEGETAVQMVPVNVDKAKVDVARKELENKAQFETISRQLTVELAKIEAEKEVRISFANAMGEALAKAKMTVWGSPDTVVKMSEAFTKGQSWANTFDGFTSSMTGETQDLVNGALNGVLGLVERVTGTKPTVSSDTTSIVKIENPAVDHNSGRVE